HFAISLNEEQRKVYFLVCDRHQKNQILNHKPTQLLLYLSGSGETAPTGIAATNICRSTIHSACKLGFSKNSKNTTILSEESLHQLQETWSKIEYVIIDEISIISQSLLAQFHTFIKKLKATDDLTPFAKLNILFVSDFIQLPSVLDLTLYVPNKITLISSILNSQCYNQFENLSKYTKIKCNIDLSSINNQSVTNTTGRNLWLTVKHVINLKKPIC
ncbi:22307_t:CDS:2, partial [Cetraspora pellucida]